MFKCQGTSFELTVFTHTHYLLSQGETWPSNPDEFLDSLLKLEDHPFEILDDNDIFTVPDAIDISVGNSSCSDSGLSSDQQFSPMIHDADDEDAGDFMTTSGSEGSPRPHFYASMDSPIKEEEIEIDESVYDLSDTETVGDVIVDDNYAIDDTSALDQVYWPVKQTAEAA